jgi:membrane protease YdiL (CAAX protease family)
MDDSMERRVDRGEIVRFVAITYAWSWMLWTPVVLGAYGVIDRVGAYSPNWFYDFAHSSRITLAHVLTLLGGCGPMVAATWMVYARGGAPSVRALWRKALDVRRAHPGWVLAAVLFPVGYVGLSYAITSAVTGQPVAFGTGPLAADSVAVVVGLFLISVSAMAIMIVIEEMGWRAYLLPLLQRRRSALAASVWVGVIWAYWHLPYYLVLLNPEAGNPETLGIALFWSLTTPVSTIPMAIFLTFFYNSTGGSLLVVMALHGAHNSTLRLLAMDPNGERSGAAGVQLVAETLVPIVLAVALVAIVGKANLSRRSKQVAPVEGYPHPSRRSAPQRT